MSRTEIEIQITDLIKELPDQVLQEALVILKDLDKKSKNINLSKNLGKVLKEDDGLLKRLAK